MSNETLIVVAVYLLIAVAFIVLGAHLFQRRPPEVDLTDEGFGRWLRAQRPPLPWFLGLPAEQQESMAALGDAYVQDVAIGLGYAIQNPVAAEAGLNQDPQAGEVDLVQQLAKAAAAKLMPRPVPSRPVPSMGGMARRREQRAAATAAPHVGPIFGGKPQGGAD